MDFLGLQASTGATPHIKSRRFLPHPLKLIIHPSSCLTADSVAHKPHGLV